MPRYNSDKTMTPITNYEEYKEQHLETTAKAIADAIYDGKNTSYQVCLYLNARNILTLRESAWTSGNLFRYVRNHLDVISRYIAQDKIQEVFYNRTEKNGARIGRTTEAIIKAMKSGLTSYEDIAAHLRKQGIARSDGKPFDACAARNFIQNHCIRIVGDNRQSE